MIGKGPPTLEEVYDSGRDILQSSGAVKHLVRRISQVGDEINPSIFIRLLNGDFSPTSENDIRTLASIVRVPRWPEERSRTKDGRAQIESYFKCIGKEFTEKDRQMLIRMGIKF